MNNSNVEASTSTKVHNVTVVLPDIGAKYSGSYDECWCEGDLGLD